MPQSLELKNSFLRLFSEYEKPLKTKYGHVRPGSQNYSKKNFMLAPLVKALVWPHQVLDWHFEVSQYPCEILSRNPFSMT